jgi:DNA-binding transcriptional LysR family regulator
MSSAVPFSIKQIEAFIAVVRHGSATKAGLALGLSQPAVSRAIMQLEKGLGEKLFANESTRFVPNEAGRSLVAKALALLAAAEDLGASFRGPASAIRGSIRAGASTTIATSLMPSVIGSFKREYPSVSVSVLVGNYQSVLKMIADYEIDVGFVAGAAPRSDMSLIPWALDQLCVICSPQHPLAGRCLERAGELADQRWVLREPGSGSRETLFTALGACGVEPLVAYELGSNEAVRKGVAQGLGLGCMSLALVGEDIDRGSLSSVGCPFLKLERNYSIARRKGGPTTGIMGAFMEFCMDEASRCPGVRPFPTTLV